MTFNPSVPLVTDSPSLFPPQNQTNMGRLQTIVGADHQFNTSAAANDGYHNIIHLTQQAPSGALAATGRLFAKSSNGVQLFYMDDSGNQYQLSPNFRVLAFVNFDGTGSDNANQAIRSSFNVANVFKTDDGQYNINYATPLPDANYIVQVNGMTDDSTEGVAGSVRGNATYSNSVSAAFVRVIYYAVEGGTIDVLMGSVMVFADV